MIGNGKVSRYKNKQWERKRNYILSVYDYECQDAKRFGKTIKADMVHHIYPIEAYPELKYVDWNLIPLTNTNHNKMHDRVTNKITTYGKQWQRMRRNEFRRWQLERENNKDNSDSNDNDGSSSD